MQKWFLMFASSIILASCASSNTDQESPDSSATSISSGEERGEEGRVEASDEAIAEIETTLHDFDPFVSDDTFMNEGGKQGWDDYVAASEAFSYSQFDDDSDKNGSTMEEIQELFPDVEWTESSDLDEKISILLFKYPEKPDQPRDENAKILSEMAFIFHNDHLVASSVTAGNVVESQEEELLFEDVVAYTTLEELMDNKPKVYSIGEVMYDGTMYRQVMIPSLAKLQDNSEQVVATYVNYDGNMQNGYNATNLEDASQDLMWYSYLSFKDYVENYLSKSSS